MKNRCTFGRERGRKCFIRARAQYGQVASQALGKYGIIAVTFSKNIRIRSSKYFFEEKNVRKKIEHLMGVSRRKVESPTFEKKYGTLGQTILSTFRIVYNLNVRIFLGQMCLVKFENSS
jgi:hypothetical protein